MITDQQLQQFWRDGYLPLGQVADDDQLAALRQRMDDIMQGRYRYPGMFFQLDSDSGAYGDVPRGGEWAVATLAYRKIEQLERDDLFLAYLQHPVFRELTRRIIGEEVAIYRSMFMNKPARQGTVLPFHQDGGTTWRLTLDPPVTVWTALDDASSANGAVEIVPGSHTLGLLSDFGHTITASQVEHYCPPGRSVFLEARAGEVFVLHNWLLHRSGVNATDQSRRGFSVCYMDAATRRRDRPDEPFPQVFGEGALEPGFSPPEVVAAD